MRSRDSRATASARRPCNSTPTAPPSGGLTINHALQQQAQLALRHLARRIGRQGLELFEELDDLGLLIFAERRETLAMRSRLAGVVQDGFGDRRQVAAMSVGRGVANVPELARQELIERHAVLNQPLVTEERVLIVTDEVTLQIRVGAHDC